MAPDTSTSSSKPTARRGAGFSPLAGFAFVRCPPFQGTIVSTTSATTRHWGEYVIAAMLSRTKCRVVMLETSLFVLMP